MIWGILKPTVSGPGMAVDQFLTGWLVMEGDNSRFGARQSELVDRLRGEAAISGVTLSAFPLMEESGANVEVDGGAERATGQTAFNRVDRAFFDVFGARFRAGRTFDATDFGRGQSQAIIVNRTFAIEIAGTENPLGHRVRYATRAGNWRITRARGTRLSVWWRISPRTTTEPPFTIRCCRRRFTRWASRFASDPTRGWQRLDSGK